MVLKVLAGVLSVGLNAMVGWANWKHPHRRWLTAINAGLVALYVYIGYQGFSSMV